MLDRESALEMKEFDRETLRQLQSADLDLKIYLTIERLEKARGDSYLSFSGGKDSMVLLDIMRKNKIDIPVMFIDTGLEYPEVRELGLKYADDVVKPKMTFKQVLDKYGYPVISKTQAMAIRKITTQNLTEKYRNKLLYGDEKGTAGKLSDKWHYLLDAPFKISEQCCDVMKKRPAHNYVKEILKEYGCLLTTITAEMTDESLNRQTQYLKNGCFQNTKYPKLTPMAFWTEQDVLEYIHTNKLQIASVYGEVTKDELGRYNLTGVKRTGCIFCMFGCHMDKSPNRFQQMHDTHPKLYNYCIEDLGLGEILDHLDVDYEPCGTIKEKMGGQMKIV